MLISHCSNDFRPRKSRRLVFFFTCFEEPAYSIAPSPVFGFWRSHFYVHRDVQWGARVTSLDEFNDFLDYFQAQGYNEVDTARLYQNGLQEGFTAKARWKERGLKLATKVGWLEAFKLSLCSLMFQEVDLSHALFFSYNRQLTYYDG